MLFKDKLANIEQEDTYYRAINLIGKRERPSKDYFDFLARKRFLEELDIEGKRLVIKLHLKKKIKGTDESEVIPQSKGNRILFI